MNFGDLQRTKPFSTQWGYDRGTPLDRRYIESFLSSHAGDIRGRVLEIGSPDYTHQFGGSAVEVSDVFNRHPGGPDTTFHGDLADQGSLPGDTFDCIIFTQTLHLIFDMRAALANLHESLRPGGVLLATAPYICPIEKAGWRDSWYWALTPLALRRLLTEAFPRGEVQIGSFGNVMAATAFLYGLAEEELAPEDLDKHDPSFPVTVVGRAQKAA